MADALMELIQELASPPGTPDKSRAKVGPSSTEQPPLPTTSTGTLETSLASSTLGTRKGSARRPNSAGQSVDMVELAQRSSEAPLTEKERSLLYSYLLTLTKEALLDFQVKSRPQRTIQLQSTTLLYDLDVEQYGIYFDHEASAKSSVQERQIYLRPKAGSTSSPRFQIFCPPSDGSYALTIEPSKGKIAAGKPLAIEFKLEFKDAKPPSSLIDVVVEMLVQGGYRHFFTVKSRSSSMLASQAILTVQKLSKDTIFPGWTYSIPKPLVRLRIMLVHANGLETPNVFRTQGASWEVQALSTHVQKGTYYACSDVHAIATCIKAYLRALPPLFGKIPNEVILDPPSSAFEQLQGYSLLPGELDLILWLIDLLVSVALKESVNEMNTR
ncbi:hypothetical protein HDU91_001847, partial [Kappamyces sp. JEL0680]